MRKAFRGVWALLGLAVLLGCRYTFVPLDPGKAAFPDRVMLSGTIQVVEHGAVVKLSLRRMPEPGYLELRWYKDEQLFEEKSIWAEGPGEFEARFDRIDEGYYRLVVLVKNSPLLQLELGTPLLPSPPAPPPNPSP
ncbi:hypothetical protein [Meiothermus granaticius]|uniref:hypothetical protein n=2 Tax=Meiothermus granaticius TaxID=863370 RepID=UPI0011941D8D|nr:hypothetical protein [Meiothermus granaticius]GEM85583.1 hypothetical protein MGR01S_02080 [Meiothermus granaticius NBRC 107808]